MRSALTVLVFLLLNIPLKADFLTEQKRFKRVREAISEKEQIIEKQLKEKGQAKDDFNLLILAYKSE